MARSLHGEGRVEVHRLARADADRELAGLDRPRVPHGPDGKLAVLDGNRDSLRAAGATGRSMVSMVVDAMEEEVEGGE